MKKLQEVSRNPESDQGVNKQVSRFSAAYWEARVFRPTYTRNGETFTVAEWYAQPQFASRREKVALGTNNREEAGRKAARFYKTIRSKGWDEALRQFAPERSRPDVGTVGGYLKACKSVFNGRPRTWSMYAYSLRKIAMEIENGRGEDESKYDPFHKVWQAQADGLDLSSLTAESIKSWKTDFLATAADQQRAPRNVNSFLLNARTLFGKRMIARLTENKLPTVPNPFDGVPLEKTGGDAKYVSTIEAAELLRLAKNELATKDPESYKVILLALGAGLRRGEIDMLRRSELGEREAVIRIREHEFFKAKTQSSLGDVYVDPALLAEIKRHVTGDGVFVIEPKTQPALNRAPGYYRCWQTLEEVTKWLRAHGVEGKKPMHTLRKEFGSLVNAATDIHTASNQLRHSTIKVTSAVYADNRRRGAVPIGAMLNGKAVTK
jgi:integrase